MRRAGFIIVVCAIFGMVAAGSGLPGSSHAGTQPFLHGAICPHGMDSKAEVSARLGEPNFAPAGWTTEHVALSNIVVLTVASVYNGSSPYSHLTQAYGVGFSFTGPGCQAAAGYTTLQLAVQAVVDLGDLAMSDSIELLVYDDGINPISFIWLECGNYSQQPPSPIVKPTVNGRKFEDRNANGANDSEPGIGGWPIFLNGTDRGGNAVNLSTATNGSGDYMFTVLPGSYTVSEGGMPGWFQSHPVGGTHGVSLLTGQSAPGRNFGNWRYASVAGVKYDDLNGNGVQNGGEPGLSGWDIHLVGTDGMGNPVSRTETTGAGGTFTFSNVVPGNYTVSETLKVDEDWVQTQPAGGTYIIQPQSGQTVTGISFGNLVRAEVHGSKFEDLNEDGDEDPEDNGLGGWQIRLQGVDGMGNGVNRTTNTLTDGTYEFLEIMPGTYTVCETHPDPTVWYQTRPAPPPDRKCYSFVLQSHSVESGVDFGNYERSTIRGIKFSDEHKDGENDNGDFPLPGWEVRLLDCSNPPNLIPQSAGPITQPGQTSSPNPQLTNASGQYEFAGVHNQCYRIEEVVQEPDWEQTKPCLDPAPSCGYQVDELLSGSDVVLDFGNFERPRIDKIPEGNENNVDLSIPAANLWLCEDTDGPGPICDGPGEGSLLVIERVTNVHTGDQNGDLIEDGLGAYEFTVEYDNFVIASVNPCDIVFGPSGAGAARGLVDELDTSDNPYCSDDPGVANNGTCTMSAILENLLHFGCVTNGQTPGPVNDFDLAALNLVPHEDLRNDIFPGNDNGVVTVIKDNGCELVDVFGHPIIGSINGGLTPFCTNLAITVRILEGDLNLDCDVDVTDAQLIAARFGAFFGGLGYSKWYDLEPNLHDLDIDIKDLQKVFGRDGSTCQEPVPAQPPLPQPAI